MSVREVSNRLLPLLSLTFILLGPSHVAHSQQAAIQNASLSDTTFVEDEDPDSTDFNKADQQLPSHPLFNSSIHDPVPLHFDQEHLRLALRFEPGEGQIFGVAKIRVRPASDTLNALDISAKNLDIYSVQIGVLDSTKVESAYADTTEGLLRVRLDSLQVRGVPFEVQITYRATPKAGMHFEEVKSSDISDGIHIWTDGTIEGNQHWIPLLNNPADRLTSEIIATVPPSLDVISNGRIVEEMETQDGMSLFHYLQEQSHSPGDIGLFIGRFTRSEQMLRLRNGFSVPIQQWTSEGSREKAEKSFEEVPDILFYFSEKLDFTYPWPAYSQIVFENRYIANTSFTGFTVFNNRVFVDERAIVDQPNTFELASALARQWFGHLVSADHHSDVWLTESLANFLGLMYIKDTMGEPAYFSLLRQRSNNYFEEAISYQRPLVWNQWHTTDQLLDNHASGKGTWLFHSLAESLGEDTFWALLQSFVKAQAFQATNTDKFLAALLDVHESLSSENDYYSGFFDDWVYSAGHPQINVDYQYDMVSESLYVSVEQFQEGFLVPPVFNLEIPVETYTLAGPSRKTLSVTERDQLFSIPMSIQPRYILLDPDHALLSTISVTQSANAWVSQLRYASHPLSQLKALEHLEEYTDDPALFIGLQNALRSRPVAEVRAKIIELISLLPQSDATKRSLLETYELDDSPLVKRAVIRGLEQFADKADLIILAMEAAQSARSYLLQAQAVATLVKIDAPGAFDILQSALITPSYKDIVRQTALRSVQFTSLTTRERVALGQKHVSSKNSLEVRLAAMELLAELAQLGNKRSLTSLTALLDDDNAIIRQTVALYLGLAGNSDTIDALEERLDVELHPFTKVTLQDAIQRLKSFLEESASS